MLELYGEGGMLKLRSWSALGFQEFPDRLAAFATKGDRHAELQPGIGVIYSAPKRRPQSLPET